jgi:hypothetical protein
MVSLLSIQMLLSTARNKGAVSARIRGCGSLTGYVYDYVDFVVPMLRRMFERRRRGYRQLGYEICGEPARLRLDAVENGSIHNPEGNGRRDLKGYDEKES